jgi:hypothetical protein
MAHYTSQITIFQLGSLWICSCRTWIEMKKWVNMLKIKPSNNLEIFL